MRIANHKHHFGETVRPTMLSKLSLIEDARNPFLLRDSFQVTPTLAGLKYINPTAPLIVLDELRRCGSVAATHRSNGYIQSGLST